ncbi:hypothetical protein KAX22_09275 [bacterium]|nr:hypothetical protein [bacterium]
MKCGWRAIFVAVMILGLPWVGMATTIYDVQYNETNQGSGDDCYPSPLDGQQVTISGIVTAVMTGTYQNFWLEDFDNGLWGGVFIFDSTIKPSPGDSLTITATPDEYYGLTEMKSVSNFELHSSGNPMPSILDITTADLAGGCNAHSEAYEGMLVRVRDVVVTQGLDSHGQWYVDDGSGECQIDDDLFHYDPVMGENIAVIIGLADYSYSEYELIPRDADDIILEITGSPTIRNTAHDPVSPLFTESVTVTSQVTDDGTVSSVTLFYSADGGTSWDFTSMTDDGVAPDETAADDVYTGLIGAQAEGIEVEYYIQATDNEDLESFDPQNAPTSTYSYVVRGGLPGDGSGTAIISPDSVDLSQAVVETLTVTGEPALQTPLVTVIVVVPQGWSWSQSAADVSLAEEGFSGATVGVVGDTITVTSAAVNDRTPGQVIIAGLTSPGSMTTSTFLVKTSVEGGAPAEIDSPPQVVVGAVGPEITPIADIQADPSQYEGKTVTVRAVVTIGAGPLDNTKTRAYVQDESGRGINLFDYDLHSTLARGNLVEVTGEVEDYLGSGYISATTEIKDITVTVLDTNQALPDPILLSTGGANDAEWDGTWIQVTGVMLEDPYLIGGGYNVNLDDGSGQICIRIWETTGIDVSEFTEGDTVTAIGVGSVYSSTYQILTGYQEDIFEGQPQAEGIGYASISPATVNATDEGFTETVTIWSESTFVLTDISVEIPLSWTWNLPQVGSIQLSGAGFPSSTTVEISGERTIIIHQAAVTETDQGVMAILDLNAPTIGEISVFRVKTAVSGQSLKEIQNSPRVTVEGLDKAILSIEPRVFVPNRGSYTDTDGFLIEFNVPTNSDVVLRLYNIEGRVVRTLVDEEQYAGPGQVVWNGRDELRGVVPMGVYICHLEATDRDKGITTTDQAPIVVGTPLN